MRRRCREPLYQDTCSDSDLGDEPTLEELAPKPPDPYPSSTNFYYGYSSMDDKSDEEPTPWVVKPKPAVHT